MKFFKQVLPNQTRSLLQNNVRELPASNIHDLERVKKYALAAGTETRECQAPSVST